MTTTTINTRVLIDFCHYYDRGSAERHAASRIDSAIYNEQWQLALAEALKVHQWGWVPEHLQLQWRQLVNQIQERIDGKTN